MKIKDGYVIKSVAGAKMILPLCNPYFKSVITVNDTGEFLFELMKNEKTVDELVDAMLLEFEVDSDTAKADVIKFVDSLRQAELLDE